MRIQLSTSLFLSNYSFKRSNQKDEIATENKDETINDIKTNNKIGTAVTISALSAVAGAFMMSRGFQKNSSKYLNRVKSYLDKRLAVSSLTKSSKHSSFYEYFIKKINSFIHKSESINNITSLKDILFMKLMYKTKPTKKIHQSITNYFEKLSRNTVINSYKKAEKDFNRMNAIFDKLDEYILTNYANETVKYERDNVEKTLYTKKELVEKARLYRKTANDILKSFTDKKSMDYRYNYINNVTSTLYSRFWDASFKDFWSKNNKFKRKEMWQSFIAAEQIKGDKTELSRIIAIARNALTYTTKDRNEFISDYIKKLDGIIPLNDKDGQKIIKRLEWFANSPEALQENKDIFTQELDNLKKHKIRIIDKNIAKTQEEFKNTYIEIINELTGNTKGEIQDMLSIYYKIAPYELDSTGASLAVKKAVKSFDKSVDLECVEFFDKVRDLRLGSAPTDVLTILFSFITLSFGLGYTKDKDKQKSIMLKSGIPIVGGITMATLTATKLVSGGKSLAAGIFVGIALNKLGIIADNIRKKYQKK